MQLGDGLQLIYSPYRAVNTLRLGYKNQLVYAVYGNNRYLTNGYVRKEWTQPSVEVFNKATCFDLSGHHQAKLVQKV
jgi:hypothetical protein